MVERVDSRNDAGTFRWGFGGSRLLKGCLKRLTDLSTLSVPKMTPFCWLTFCSAGVLNTTVRRAGALKTARAAECAVRALALVGCGGTPVLGRRITAASISK